MCENVAHHLVGYCRRKLAEDEITTRDAALERCLVGLRNKKWFTLARNVWMVRRTAVFLGWKTPRSIGPDGSAGRTSWRTPKAAVLPTRSTQRTLALTDSPKHRPHQGFQAARASSTVLPTSDTVARPMSRRQRRSS